MVLKELEQLFSEWQEARPEYKGKFVEDGIFDEQKWNAAERKVLFVLKEANNTKPEGLRYLVMEKWKGPKWQAFLNVGRWAYGIQHMTEGPNFDTAVPEYEVANEPENRKEAFVSSAVVNLKKPFGGGWSDSDTIRQYAIKDAEFINREIDILKPNIIVCGGTIIPFREIYDKSKQSSVSKRVNKINNTPVIAFDHPSARATPDVMYTALCAFIWEGLRNGTIDLPWYAPDKKH